MAARFFEHAVLGRVQAIEVLQPQLQAIEGKFLIGCDLVGGRQDVQRLVARLFLLRAVRFRHGAQGSRLGHLSTLLCRCTSLAKHPSKVLARQRPTRGAFADDLKIDLFGKVRKFSDPKYMKFR